MNAVHRTECWIITCDGADFTVNWVQESFNCIQNAPYGPPLLRRNVIINAFSNPPPLEHPLSPIRRPPDLEGIQFTSPRSPPDNPFKFGGIQWASPGPLYKRPPLERSPIKMTKVPSKMSPAWIRNPINITYKCPSNFSHLKGIQW